jgi:hypothetical protein
MGLEFFTTLLIMMANDPKDFSSQNSVRIASSFHLCKIYIMGTCPIAIQKILDTHTQWERHTEDAKRNGRQKSTIDCIL